MTVIADAAIVAGIILDIIEMYQERGVDVDMDSLEEAIANLKARKDKARAKLKRL